MSSRQHPQHVNKFGYLAHHEAPEGRRTYVCADIEALWSLTERLTGRNRDTFAMSEMGIPRVPEISINYPVHIYSTAFERGSVK